MSNATTATAGAATTTAPATYPKRQPKEVWIKRRFENPILIEEGLMENSAMSYKLYLGGAYASYSTGIHLGRTIWDSPEQEKKIMAPILGISPEALNYEEKLTEYWKNFNRPIPYHGLKLEAGVVYTSAQEYSPINAADYITYRYALKHGWVANKMEDMRKSNKIQFYLWNKEDEMKGKLDKQELKDRAFALRLEIADANKIQAILSLTGKAGLSGGEAKIALAALAEEAPAKFISLAGDPDLLDKAFIELAVQKGVITRPVNTTLHLYENVTIGNNIGEAVAWLRNPVNAANKTVIEARVKTF